jgi:hypothetical protein
MYDQLRQWHIRRLNVDAETSVHPKALCHVPIACMDNAAEHVSLAYRALSGGVFAVPGGTTGRCSDASGMIEVGHIRCQDPLELLLAQSIPVVA